MGGDKTRRLSKQNVSKHNELNLTVGIMTLITLEFLRFFRRPAQRRAGAVLLLPQLKNEC